MIKVIKVKSYKTKIKLQVTPVHHGPRQDRARAELNQDIAELKEMVAKTHELLLRLLAAQSRDVPPTSVGFAGGVRC